MLGTIVFTHFYLSDDLTLTVIRRLGTIFWGVAPTKVAGLLLQQPAAIVIAMVMMEIVMAMPIQVQLIKVKTRLFTGCLAVSTSVIL